MRTRLPTPPPATTSTRTRRWTRLSDSQEKDHDRASTSTRHKIWAQPIRLKWKSSSDTYVRHPVLVTCRVKADNNARRHERQAPRCAESAANGPFHLRLTADRGAFLNAETSYPGVVYTNLN
eukprot:6188231-Pleurochrysis_carterae.AAC.1